MLSSFHVGCFWIEEEFVNSSFIYTVKLNYINVMTTRPLDLYESNQFLFDIDLVKNGSWQNALDRLRLHLKQYAS